MTKGMQGSLEEDTLGGPERISGLMGASTAEGFLAHQAHWASSLETHPLLFSKLITELGEMINPYHQKQIRLLKHILKGKIMKGPSSSPNIPHCVTKFNKRS